MQSNLISHIVALAFLALVIFIRFVTPLEFTGDLLLVTLIVFAWYADTALMTTLLGASTIWLSLYPGMPGALLLSIIIPLLVFAAHQAGLLTRWRPWVANLVLCVAGVLIFHAAVHASVFALVPLQIVQGTVYGLLYSAILFGILREIYVRKER